MEEGEDGGSIEYPGFGLSSTSMERWLLHDHDGSSVQPSVPSSTGAIVS